MKTIMVQMSEHEWTMQAIHFACALARTNQTTILLLRMIPVTHPQYLGTPYGYCALSGQELKAIGEYGATAEDYQVTLAVQPMQYVTALDAIVDAADLFDVDIVFANIPTSVIPYWRQFRTWQLTRRLAAKHRRLYTLANDQPDQDELPYIINAPAHPVVR